jgi:hypothetical protein
MESGIAVEEKSCARVGLDRRTKEKITRARLKKT